MTFDDAIKTAKQNNLPYEYQRDMVASGFFNTGAETQFKNDFIFLVKMLSK